MRLEMIGEGLNILQKKGFRGLISLTVNHFLIRVFGIRLTRDSSIARNPVAKKIFSKCKLDYSKEGFYFLSPMPSVQELNDYYSSIYWERGEGKNYVVNLRDIVHFKILEEFIPQHLNQGKVFLNFGAGHGGISSLFWLKGMKIVNVEPSLLPQFYTERWKMVKAISKVEDNSVDVIYGSHSLEHVQDIESFKAEISRILKPNGFIFWEVPNANCPGTGPLEGKVRVPHTYYFETKFFEKWFSKCLICSGYEQSHARENGYVIQDWQKFKNEKGDVIRVLGQID